MPDFPNAVNANMHFVNSFCEGNAQNFISIQTENNQTCLQWYANLTEVDAS
jgi:hypothetical protein